METKKMKCPNCGYKFDGDPSNSDGICPLCSQEYSTEKAVEYYKLTYGDRQEDMNATQSVGKKFLDWVIFAAAFIAFIVILYFIISYIVSV